MRHLKDSYKVVFLGSTIHSKKGVYVALDEIPWLMAAKAAWLNAQEIA